MQGRAIEKYKYMSFVIETASEYKYQIVMETTEWNTSKQVSAKETALRNVCKYLKSFFLFLKQSKYRETETRKQNYHKLHLAISPLILR